MVLLLACALLMRYTIVNNQHANVVRTLHTLLVWEPALTVRTLRVSLRTVHLAVVAVLRRTVDLLWLRVLPRCLAAGRLVADRRKLRSAHLRLHHVLLILTRLSLRLRSVLAGPSSFLALSLFFGLALVLLFLLLRLPFFANLLELYMSQASQHMHGKIQVNGKASSR